MTPYELHLGDALAFMATLPDASVDHVITDPPYEVEAHTLQRRIESGAIADAKTALHRLAGNGEGEQ